MTGGLFSLADEGQDEGAAVRRGAVIEQEDALPSAELQPSVGDGDAELGLGQRALDVGRHVVQKVCGMSFQTLTLKSIRARPVVLELKRPVVARIATLADWPLILIDLYTEEGVIGRAYLEPYIAKSMRYLIPTLHDLGEMLKGRRLAPIEFYEAARKSLHFVGYGGMFRDRPVADVFEL